MAPMSATQVLFLAFGDRLDAVELAREAGEQLSRDEITSSLHLLDDSRPARVEAGTVVVSLGR